MRTPILAALAFATVAIHAADPAPAAPAVKAPETAPAVPSKPLTADEQRRGFVQAGFQLGRGSPLPGFRTQYEMSEAEVDAFLAGLRTAMLAGSVEPDADETLQARFTELLNGRVVSKSSRVKAENVAFLAKVDADKSVTRTASGLRYRIDKAGSGAKPVATSQVTCRYTGQLCNGKVFDSTKSRKDEPVTFTLNEVIPGWTEGLQLIAKGGVIRLWIPANLAYGDQEQDVIPAGSVLEFEVELVDVK
jgi:FKBP-type peptidyl-prolyl cis-trans isomerase